jgi:predicted nuclease of predicted toxin-antitoxin system
VRLLLDEHFSPRIAHALRSRGHDVIAVKERPDLLGLSDRLVFVAGAAEGRAVVTIDVKGFRQLAADASRRGAPTRGIVLVPRRRFSRTAEKSEAIVVALDRLMRELPGDDDLVARRGGEVWLQQPS